jgi:hypothetical protein
MKFHDRCAAEHAAQWQRAMLCQGDHRADSPSAVYPSEGVVCWRAGPQASKRCAEICASIQQHVRLLHRASDQVPATAKLRSLLGLKVSILIRGCDTLSEGLRGFANMSGLVLR